MRSTIHRIGNRKKREEPYKFSGKPNYEDDVITKSLAPITNKWLFGHKVEKRATGNIFIR